MGFIRTDGWLEGVRRVATANFNSRPNGEVSLLVVHNISLPPGRFGGGYIEQFFCNRLNRDEHPYFNEIADLQVSAHCLIYRDGSLVQFVSFLDRAWHAGRSTFQGRAECNDYSVGVELEGADEIPYTEAQYQALASLTVALMQRYPSLTPERIAGHCDIAPERKTDPGAAFDWHHFRRLLDSRCRTGFSAEPEPR